MGSRNARTETPQLLHTCASESEKDGSRRASETHDRGRVVNARLTPTFSALRAHVTVGTLTVNE